MNKTNPINDSAPEIPASTGVPVGEQIRDLRKAKGKTLQNLADAIGRSVGYVSQIERNLSVVSIPVLHGIALELGVNISWFFQGNAQAPAHERDIIVRADARRRLDFTGTGMIEELLSPNLGGAYQMVLGTFAPGAETADKTYSRTGEESGYIIKGQLELWLGERHFLMGPGDTFTFSVTEPHRSRNPGTTETVVLWVIAPPSY